ncbi:MAG: ribosome silencing factor [Thermodesulfovibrionales bacterium]|nr:ribosome silencing factor [Thermodesulfovibrionales bacterium]
MLIIETEILAKKIAQYALEKKAENVVILDLREITVIADFFIICSGNSITQVQAISDFILEKAKKEDNFVPLRVEGKLYAKWILVDYGTIVVHIFDNETREYYNLERLWIDAKRVPTD